MSRHTPGPWEINTASGRVPAVRKVRMPHGEADTFQSSIQVAGGPPFKHVCRLDFGYGKKEDEANARLIAAAPELLAALMALKRGECWCDTGWTVITHLPECLEAQKAITKAEAQSE